MFEFFPVSLALSEVLCCDIELYGCNDIDESQGRNEEAFFALANAEHSITDYEAGGE